MLITLLLIFALIMLMISMYLWGLSIYYWTLSIPTVLVIWFSWSTISAFGFLGYLGTLALLILPIAFACDKALDSREYFGTGISATILLGIASLYSLIAYWDVAKWVLGVSFFVGCAAVILSSKGEIENA